MSQGSIKYLAVMCYANPARSGGLTWWTYADPSRLVEDVMRAGFFDGLSDQLGGGDFILASCADGGVMLYVARSDPNAVMISPMGRSTK